MAAFKFRLQSVLGLKEKLENQKELEYGRALRKLAAEKELEQELKDKREQAIGDMSNGITERINPERIQRYNNYIAALKDRIAAQAKAVTAAAAAVERRRLELVEAMRERKTLEKLKENDRELYLDEEKQAEQKMVDQTVSYQFNKHS